MSGQSIVQTTREVITVIFWQGHKRPAQHDEFDFISGVTEALELFEPTLALLERVVTGTNGSHRCWLVAGVTLRRVLKAGVGAAGTIDAYVARVDDVWATVRLAHHGYDGDTGDRANRFSLKVGRQASFLVIWDCGQDFNQFRCFIQRRFAGELPNH